MTTADWNSLAERLTKALRPVAAPLAIPFSPARQENIPAFFSKRSNLPVVGVAVAEHVPTGNFPAGRPCSRRRSQNRNKLAAILTVDRKVAV